MQEVEEIKGQYQKEMEIFKHDLQAEVLKKEELELEKEALQQQIEQSAKVVENQKEEIENKAIEVRNRISQHETEIKNLKQHFEVKINERVDLESSESSRILVSKNRRVGS